jgi:hypothetical protein
MLWEADLAPYRMTNPREIKNTQNMHQEEMMCLTATPQIRYFLI